MAHLTFEKLDRMKELPDTMSPLSWMFFYIGTLSVYLTVFRPTPLEMFMAIVADWVMLFLCLSHTKERRFFLFFFPQYKLLYPDFDHQTISKFSFEERKTFFDTLLNFPADRAKWVLYASSVKTFPGWLIVLFIWQYDNSLSIQLLKVIFVSLVLFSYFFGAVFLETHETISKKIEELHSKHDFTDVFRVSTVRDTKRDFYFHEVAAMSAVWVTAMGLLLVKVLGEKNQTWLVLETTVLAVVMLGLLFRIWYLGRRFFMGCLEHIFHELEFYEPGQIKKAIPLHSSHILARFDQVFNTLFDNLRMHREEIDRWVAIEIEGSRFRALGGISALVVHDLSGPLHVMRFCIDQLNDKCDSAKAPTYLEKLAQNSERALDLVSSLRAYLRTERGPIEGTVFEEAHNHVMKYLNTQYAATAYDKITIIVDEKVYSLCFRLVKADLVHILHNLYANSIDNLNSHEIEKPFIKIEMVMQDSNVATIAIRDNGSGLSLDEYEYLTTMALTTNTARDGEQKKGSLGLKLVRRLVERLGGKLAIVKEPAFKEGTNFHLTLDLVPIPGEFEIRRLGG